jgi:hypothetical protein
MGPTSAHRAAAQAVVDRSQWWTPTDLRKRVLDTWDIGLDAAACNESALVDNWLGPTHPDRQRRDARTAHGESAHALPRVQCGVQRALSLAFQHSHSGTPRPVGEPGAR